MSEPEALFERYREDGDVAAFGLLYDQLAPELCALAVRFAPSVAEAEDLVQSSFLALLERPHAFHRDARLVPFLVGILARQAGAARRRARRAVDPKRLDPRAVEEPQRASEAGELDAELRVALERLPDIYREALRLHLLEGRRPLEIALRLGRTPGTVATQIQRGLGLLRRALPRGLAGAGLAALLPRGEAGVRAVVLARAQELAAPRLVASSSLASLGGLLVASKLAGVVLAVALVALSLWLAGRAPEAQPARAVEGARTSAETPRRAEPQAPASAQRALAATAPDEDPPESARPSGAQAPTVLVHVRGVAPRHLAELRVEATLPGMEPVSAGVDAGGTALLDLAPLLQGGSWTDEVVTLRARHPMYRAAREFMRAPGSRRDAPRECVLSPVPASVVTGRVLLPPGADPRQVRFEFRSESGEVRYKLMDSVEGPCDEEGRFRLALCFAGLHRMTVTSPAALPLETWCRLELLEELTLPDLVLEPGTAEIHGRVELPPGTQALASSRLSVRALRRDVPAETPREHRVVDRANAGSTSELRGGPRPTLQRVTLDERGHFALRGLEPGPWELELLSVAAEAVLPARMAFVVEAPASDVVLWEDRCLLAVEVIDPGGPVAGAEVTWSWEQGEHAGSQLTVTQADGRAQVVGDRTTDYALRVSAPGSEPVELRWSAAGRGVGDERRVELCASRASALELVLTTESARPGRVLLRLEPLEGEGEPRMLLAQLADGRYRFERLDPGVYRARLRPSHLGQAAISGELVCPCDLALRLEAGATTEAELTLRAGGRVRVVIDTGEEPRPDLWLPMELLGPEGPLHFTAVASLEAGEGLATLRVMDGALHLAGQNSLEAALAPGMYSFRHTGEGWSIGARTFEVCAGETTAVELVAHRQ